MEKTPKQMTPAEFEAAMDARLRHTNMVRAMEKLVPEPIPSKSPGRPDMKSAVLSVIKSQPMRADDVAFALVGKGIIVETKTVSDSLSQLANDGLILNTGQGLYCHIDGAAKLVDPQETAADKTAATNGGSISQQIMDFITAAEKPVSSNDISRALDGVTPGYVSQLLSQLLRAGMVTRNDGKWTAA